MAIWISSHLLHSRSTQKLSVLTYAPDAFEFVDLEDRSVAKEGADDARVEDVLAAARECPEQAIVVELDHDGGLR